MASMAAGLRKADTSVYSLFAGPRARALLQLEVNSRWNPVKWGLEPLSPGR